MTRREHTMDDDLDRLGDALHRAVARNIAAASEQVPPTMANPDPEVLMSTNPSNRNAPGRRPLRTRRRLVLGLAVGALVVAGAGTATAISLLSSDEVAHGLPGGSLIFVGTDPSCTTTDHETFECTLSSAPTEEVLDDYTGSAQLFTNADGDIAGGCRGRDAEGLQWTCWAGERAVDEGILVSDLLGQHLDGPHARVAALPASPGAVAVETGGAGSGAPVLCGRPGSGDDRATRQEAPVTTTDGLRYIDSDGHILEHPTAMPDYAPAEYRDRVLAHRDRRRRRRVPPLQRASSRRRTDCRSPAPPGFPDEKVDQARNGEIRYSEVRPAAHNAKARLQRHGHDGIDLAVLYPTSMLGLQSIADEDFARVQARAYNDWASDHTQEGEGRLFAAGAVPPMNDEDGVAGGGRRDPPRRRQAGHGVGVPAAEPVGRLAAVQRQGLRPGVAGGGRDRSRARVPPVPDARPPGRLPRAEAGRGRSPTGATSPSDQENPPGAMGDGQHPLHPGDRQPRRRDALDRYVTAGGVCERFPDTKFLFLEANGGWLVPWLERLDHHSKKFEWDVPWLNMLPSEYFRRQCWISFDPDESMLAFTAKLAALRRRPHRVGVGLPAPRRQVPRRHRGAGRGAGGLSPRAAERDHQRERARPVRHWLGTGRRAA